MRHVYKSDRVLEAAYWTEARRKFYDNHDFQPTLVTTHLSAPISQLYKIEAAIYAGLFERRQIVGHERSRPVDDVRHV